MKKGLRTAVSVLVIAALMLVAFAAAIPSPSITDEAYDAYMGLDLAQ